MKEKVEIGIFGGSGLYKILNKVKSIKLDTPYGYPSDNIDICEYKNKLIAFLPRHGGKHQLPPHLIPYKANLFAFKKLGIKYIIAPSASGSLKPNIIPGSFLIPDQYVNLTSARKDTYFEGSLSKNTFTKVRVAHISSDKPYCKTLSKLAYLACKKIKRRCYKKGTVVVINGPRFSTVSESQWFQKMGWEVINMTQYPEVTLAKELEMHYLNISLITDYDVGLKGNKKIKPVNTKGVLKVFTENNENVKKVILEIVKNLPSKFLCKCDSSLKQAIVS